MMPKKTSLIWHPFTQHALQDEMTKIVRGDGAYLHTADGHRIIDAISSWWVVTHGHCHPHIVSAIQEQAPQPIIFAGYTHDPAEEVAALLLKLAPRGLDHVFFSESGSASVEVALKMALGYWHNIGNQRVRIVVMQHSYHGDTVGAMSVGARGVFNATYGPLLFDVTSMPFPATDREQLTLDALESACRNEMPAAFCGASDTGGGQNADVPSLGAKRNEADLRSLGRPVHCRRGHDGLGPHRNIIRVRAGQRYARYRLLF